MQEKNNSAGKAVIETAKDVASTKKATVAQADIGGAKEYSPTNRLREDITAYAKAMAPNMRSSREDRVARQTELVTILRHMRNYGPEAFAGMMKVVIESVREYREGAFGERFRLRDWSELANRGIISTDESEELKQFLELIVTISDTKDGDPVPYDELALQRNFSADLVKLLSAAYKFKATAK